MPESASPQRTSLFKVVFGVAIAFIFLIFFGSRFMDTKKANLDERQNLSRSSGESTSPIETTQTYPPVSPPIVPNVSPKAPMIRQPVRDTRVEELAAAMSRVEEALSRCDRIGLKLDKLPMVVSEWKTLVRDLEKNELGRRLASSEVAVRTYIEVMNPTEPYAEENQLVRLRERLRILEEVPKRAKEKQDISYQIAKSWDESITALDRDVSKQQAAIEESTGLLKTLLDANPKASPNAPTLETAIGRIIQKKFDDKLAAIIKREEEAIKAGNEQIANARKVAVETDKKLEAKKSLDAAAAKEEQAKNEKLREFAKSAEVRKYLSYLFVESYYQPRRVDEATLHVVRTEKRAPMSFNIIKGIGALDEGIVGLRKLNMLYGSYRLSGTDKYERPRLQAPSNPNYWSNDHHEFLRKAQKYLIELGPILVEEGLLSE